jgi:hypothetical protein
MHPIARLALNPNVQSAAERLADAPHGSVTYLATR